MIKWEGNQPWGKEYEELPVPNGAVKLKRPDDIIKASLPYGILPMLICMSAVFFKVRTSGEFIFDLRFMPVSFLIGFLLLPVHEYLHAICYPKEAMVYVGISLKKFAAYAVSYYPISRERFIIMSLLPAVLGIAPLIIFLLCPPEWKPVLTVCVVPMFMGLISPSPDYMDVTLALRQVPKGAMIQGNNEGLFWYKQGAYKF